MILTSPDALKSFPDINHFVPHSARTCSMYGGRLPWTLTPGNLQTGKPRNPPTLPTLDRFGAQLAPTVCDRSLILEALTHLDPAFSPISDRSRLSVPIPASVPLSLWFPSPMLTPTPSWRRDNFGGRALRAEGGGVDARWRDRVP